MTAGNEDQGHPAGAVLERMRVNAAAVLHLEGCANDGAAGTQPLS